MRRPLNLKKSPTCFDVYSVASKQVGYFFQISWPFQKTWTLHSNLGLVYRYSSTSMLGNDKSVIYKLWHSIIVMIYTKSKMTTSLKITDCNLETPYKANYKIWHAFFIPFVFNYKVCRSSFLEITYIFLLRSTQY